MAKAKSPAYSMYPDAFEQGTDEMTLTEVGAYIRLLNSQWNKGSVPGDSIDALSRILRCTRSSAKSVWKVLQPKFDRGDDGKWRNPRLEVERKKQSDRRAKLAQNGARGAETRWQTDAKGNGKPMATAIANPSQTDSLPSPSPVDHHYPRAHEEHEARQHKGHLFEFCDFVCLSEHKAQNFAKTLPFGIKDPKNFGRVVDWARNVKRTWDGREKEADWWTFWENRWKERKTVAVASVDPAMAEAEARRKAVAS